MLFTIIHFVLDKRADASCTDEFITDHYFTHVIKKDIVDPSYQDMLIFLTVNYTIMKMLDFCSKP